MRFSFYSSILGERVTREIYFTPDKTWVACNGEEVVSPQYSIADNLIASYKDDTAVSKFRWLPSKRKAKR